MSEKEIKKGEVAGKKLEDLTEEELNQVQGQGDTEGETVTTITTTVTLFTNQYVFCKK